MTRKSKSLYDKLGVSKTATRAEIKRAYRQKSMKHHPDRSGDAETFKQLTLAYDVLTDDARRRDYDETGRYDESKSAPHDPVLEKFSITVSKTLIALISHNQDLERVDLGMLVDGQLLEEMKEAEKSIVDLENAIAKLERTLKRMCKKKGVESPDNFMQASTRALILNLRQQIKNAKRDYDLCKQAREMLRDYAYEVDRSPSHSTSPFADCTFGGMHMKVFLGGRP